MSVDYLQWIKSDFQILLQDTDTFDFTQSKSTYPWKIMDWTTDDSVAYGAGVIQFPNFTDVNAATVLSLNNFFNWEAWSELIQLALENKNIATNTNLLLNDGQFATNKNTTVSLLQYVQDMLSPFVSSSTGSKPYSGQDGRFNPDRLVCRNTTSTAQPMQLPLVFNLKNNNWTDYLAVLPVIPPRGYVNVGQFITCLQGNLSGWRYPPTKLLFIAKDARFVQPPKTAPWPWNPVSTFTNIVNQRAGITFTKIISQLNVSETGTVQKNYVYSSLGSVVFNAIVPISDEPSFDTYPNTFPWAVNLQLVRFFPNGPNGVQDKFTPINVDKLIQQGYWLPIKTSDNNKNSPAARILNPNYSTTLYYPIENGYESKDLNLSFTPDNEPGKTTWPILIPFGIRESLYCCIGEYSNTNLNWEWSLFPPFPATVTPADTKTTAQAICRAGGWSFKYSPGPDCNVLTTAYCNPGTEVYKESSNCNCYNTQRLFDELNFDSSDPGTKNAELVIATNIACVYTECSNVPSSLKNTAMVGCPNNGTTCPSIVNCIISGNTFNGDKSQLINSCTAGGTLPRTTPRIDYNIIIQVFFIAAAVLFVVIGIAVLLLRIRKRRKTDTDSDYDPYDDDEDLPSEYSMAFPKKKKKQK